MRRFLGDKEYQDFVRSFDFEAQTGLRVNTLKISVADFISIAPFALSPVGDHEPAGFLVTDDSRPGSHPYHAAGLFYLQEPSAIVVASLIRPEPGDLVLDLAAAPGGKATHLAALLEGSGLLLANDVSRGRVSHLVQNLEKWGCRNSLITNNTPARLVAAYGALFDKVLVDAPCSGEGMFRRRGALEWSQEIVTACARRQTSILEQAARLVCPGGLLAYATCTFSPEENEDVVGRFLDSHPEFQVAESPRYAGFEPARPDRMREDSSAWKHRQELRHAIRLWPHRFTGEGHFIALMERTGAQATLAHSSRQSPQPPSRTALNHWRRFADQHLDVNFPEERLLLAGGRLYLRPSRVVDTAKLRVVRHGLLLGEVRRGYLKPAHALALGLSPAEAKQRINWAADATEISAYLSGQSLKAEGPDGWVLVTVDGFSLGWAKRVDGILKNHYPRGLRRPPGRQ
jgi:16S rRNA C967 or C1407 C5-methylase (RsmB/RsmF family)/NOL1/NOP2/fmu family ribosome biogenesis protein